MVIYEQYQPFRSWLKKVKDKEIITAMANAQGRKTRQGNVFAVIGANDYVGWAMVCQLAYKFKGCKVILIDDNFGKKPSIMRHFDVKTRIDRLRYYFDFDYSIESNLQCVKKHKPDFIINATSNFMVPDLIELNFDKHLILFTPYMSKNKFKNLPFKITEFRTANVFGTCNFVTLIDPILSTNNSPDKFLNKMIVDAVNNKNIYISGQRMIVVSLEDITRAPIKVLRKGQKIQHRALYAYERDIVPDRVAYTIENTLKYFKINVNLSYGSQSSDSLKFYDKKPFVRLIDKYRPPVNCLISYSCKNYLDYRS